VKLHLDLFSGIGCFALALSRTTPCRHTFVEYEPHLKRVLAKNFPNSKIYEDVRNYTPDFSPWIITGGFPCQDISRANPNGKGINGNRSGLWKQFARVISESRPKYVCIENVFDLLGKGLGILLEDLASIGYDAVWTVIDSKYTGVAQRRRRVYILGVRDGIPRGADIFNCSFRSGVSVSERARVIDEHHARHHETLDKERHRIAFFTRQRSDEFASKGVSSTIAKRDYKSHTDIVLQSGLVRRVGVIERLRLQGIPENWLDGCGLTKQQMYSANGMTVPAVEWVMQKLINFDNGLDI
jgi:DNA-cytosine methyltransferase